MYSLFFWIVPRDSWLSSTESSAKNGVGEDALLVQFIDRGFLEDLVFREGARCRGRGRRLGGGGGACLVGSGAGAATGGGVGVTAGGVFLPHAATVNAEHNSAAVAHPRKLRIIKVSFANWTG